MIEKLNDEIKWVMFDMGNVLVEYNPCAYELIAKKYDVKVSDMKDLLINEDIFTRTGRGEIMGDDFIKMIKQAFGISLSYEEIVELYSKEINNEIEGIREILKELKKNHKISILSNTFFAHWDYFKTTSMHDMFDLPMASHLLKEVKPDEAIYKIALEKMKAKPNEVVFLDDLDENIEQATKMGIHAYKTLSINDTRRILTETGLLKD